MDAKMNKMLKAIQANSAATPCPASEESEDEKSELRQPAKTETENTSAGRKRTRSPAIRASTAAASAAAAISTVKKDWKIGGCTASLAIITALAPVSTASSVAADFNPLYYSVNMTQNATTIFTFDDLDDLQRTFPVYAQ